jgi:hypothetical protein
MWNRLCGDGGGRCEGDGVAEVFELGDEAAGLAFGVTPSGEVVIAEVLEYLTGAQEMPHQLDERVGDGDGRLVEFRAPDDLVFINFEGLTLDTFEEAEALAAFLGRQLHDLGRRVNVIVNYDNFELGRAAAPRFFEMVREHDRSYFLSSTRYSTDAFLRRKLGRAFADAKLSQTIYRSFEESAHALGERARPAAEPRDERA